MDGKLIQICAAFSNNDKKKTPRKEGIAQSSKQKIIQISR